MCEQGRLQLGVCGTSLVFLLWGMVNVKMINLFPCPVNVTKTFLDGPNDTFRPFLGPAQTPIGSAQGPGVDLDIHWTVCKMFYVMVCLRTANAA